MLRPLASNTRGGRHDRPSQPSCRFLLLDIKSGPRLRMAFIDEWCGSDRIGGSTTYD